MAEDEKTKKRNDLKIKKRDYTGFDDEEFVDGQIGMRRNVLAKYDEELEGPRETVSLKAYVVKISVNRPRRDSGSVVTFRSRRKPLVSSNNRPLLL